MFLVISLQENNNLVTEFSDRKEGVAICDK